MNKQMNERKKKQEKKPRNNRCQQNAKLN